MKTKLFGPRFSYFRSDIPPHRFASFLALGRTAVYVGRFVFSLFRVNYGNSSIWTPTYTILSATYNTQRTHYSTYLYDIIGTLPDGAATAGAQPISHIECESARRIGAISYTRNVTYYCCRWIVFWISHMPCDMIYHIMLSDMIYISYHIISYHVISFQDLGEGDEVARSIHHGKSLGVAVQSPARHRALDRDHFVWEIFWHLRYVPQNKTT